MNWPSKVAQFLIVSWQNKKYGNSGVDNEENSGVSFGGQEVESTTEEKEINKESPAIKISTEPKTDAGLLGSATIMTAEYSKDLPRLNLLHSSKSEPTSCDIKGNTYTIKKTFESFGIQV